MKSLTAPYLRRMRLCAALQALAWGMAFGLLIRLVGHAAVRIGGVRPSAALHPLAALGGGALLSVLAYGLALRPTQYDAARRLDEAGLEERIRTMAAHMGEDTPLLRAQRADARGHLAAFDARRFPIRVRWTPLLLCLALGAAVLSMRLVPSPVADVQEQAEREEMRLMREMLETLRAQIEQADLDDDERARLLEQLESAEGLIGEGTLEELAQITQATGEIAQEFDEIQMYKSWIYALTKYDSLRELAMAVLRRDAEQTSAVLFGMESDLLALQSQEQLDTLMALKTAIQTELEQGKPSDEEAYLCYAFDSFANDIESAAVYLYSHLNPNTLIHGGFERLRSRLAMYLSGEAELEEAEEDEETRYVLGEDAERSEDEPDGQTAAQGESEEGQAHRLLYSDDPDGMRGAGTGMRDAQHYADTEPLYEPTLDETRDAAYVPGAPDEDNLPQREPAPDTESSAAVPYDRVYGIYYARLLEQLRDGTLPEDAVGIIEAYFYAL